MLNFDVVMMTFKTIFFINLDQLTKLVEENLRITVRETSMDRDIYYMTVSCKTN